MTYPLCFQQKEETIQDGRTAQHPPSGHGPPEEDRPIKCGGSAGAVQADGQPGVAHQPEQSVTVDLLRARSSETAHLQEPRGDLRRVPAELPGLPEPAQSAGVLQTGRVRRVRWPHHALRRPGGRLPPHAGLGDPTLRLQVDHRVLPRRVCLIHGRPLQPIADGRRSILGAARARCCPLVGVQVHVRHAVGGRLCDAVRRSGGDRHRSLLWHLLHGGPAR